MQKKVYEIDDEVDTTPPKYLLTPWIGQGDQVRLEGSAQPVTVNDVGAGQYGGQSGAMNGVGQSAVVANIGQVGQSVLLLPPPLH